VQVLQVHCYVMVTISKHLLVLFILFHVFASLILIHILYICHLRSTLGPRCPDFIAYRVLLRFPYYSRQPERHAFSLSSRLPISSLCL
jgi:hypothetical protein